MTRALVGTSALVTLPGDARECSDGRAFNPRVVGSSPTGPTKHLVRRQIRDQLSRQASLYPHFTSRNLAHARLRSRDLQPIPIAFWMSNTYRFRGANPTSRGGAVMP